MSKVAVVYWSGTGNTALMAQAVAEGAKAKGAECDLLTSAEFTADMVDNYDAIAFGCPAMGAEELLGIKDQIVAYMDTVLTEKKLNMVFIMLTDILEETTYLLCAGTGADQVAEEAFKQEKDGDYYVLKGVVSRKKQIIPPFMSVLQ